jgi:hypothetical protein
MNPQEIARIVGFVHALCPAQKINELTPDAWELVLEDISFADAKAALKVLGKTLHFIAPSDIATEVRRIRNLRAGQYTDYANTLPDAHPDRALDYIAALRTDNHRAAAGATQLRPRPLEQAIEATFRYVPSAWKRGAISTPTRLAIEAAPTNPEYDQARELLGTLPPLTRQHWMTLARKQLENDGVPLDHQGIAILAADLATRPDLTTGPS